MKEEISNITDKRAKNSTDYRNRNQLNLASKVAYKLGHLEDDYPF